MRTTHRPRKQVRPIVIGLLRPLLRYSASRDAYVLRAIGNSRGPVLRGRDTGPS